MKTDKILNYLVWVCFILCVGVASIALISFKIEDKTVYKDDTRDYSTNWYLQGEDEPITLSYNENVKKDEPFSIEKKIDSDDCGQTISFLSADSKIRIYVDDEIIYEFGYKDERWFGKTPGSVWVFADIPLTGEGKTLRIEKVSPYDNYAGKFQNIIIGDRDECILKLIKDNSIKLAECIVVFLGAMLLVLIVIIMSLMKQDSRSLIYFVGFVLVSDIYYLIETKTLIVFYGNETIYSIAVFLSLIIAPVLLTQYYKNRLFVNVKKALTAIQIVAMVNCIAQITLQLTGLVDFMQMAALSHCIIGVSIIVIIYGFVSKPKKDRNIEDDIELLAVIIYMIGVSVDLINTLLGQTGDLGRYSRFVNMIYTITMVVLYCRYLIMLSFNKLNELNEKLKFEKQVAEHASEEKSVFLSNMSHEIRTPIQGILGYNEMIIRENEDKNIYDYARNVQASVRTLLGMVNQILDFTNIEDGKVSFSNEEYEIYSVMQDVTLYAEYGTKKKHLHFVTDYDENIPSTLIGDSNRVIQIINNILSNAIKYTDEGFVRMRIFWEYTDRDARKGTLNIIVTDSGIGIQEHNLKRIMDIFTRFDKVSSANERGVGLGLTIVCRLLKLMEGSFDIYSDYGNGTEVRIKIPHTAVNDDVIGKCDFSVRDEGEANSYNYSRQVRVLVVDDNDINLDVVSHTLAKNGISVYTASDGEQALEILKEDDRFDIIFMDHMMPVMDGIETITQIKKLGLCNHSKIIAFTANAVDGVKKMYINAGFDDYVTKPISAKKLLDTVHKNISDDKKEIGLAKAEANDANEADNPKEAINRSNILVVDDDLINIKVARKMLNDKFNIYTALSGSDVFGILEKEKIDLILLDVHMPEMDGHEVIKKLKKTEKYRDIPVVFLTADNDSDTEIQGLSEGAMDFITKPFIKDIVIGRIERILELGYLQNNLRNEVEKQTNKAEMRRKKVEQLSLQMVQTLASTIDAKDKYTKGHSIRVSEYSAMLAKAAGLKKEEVDNIKYAALLHDIGKIGVADSVLNKPGKLTDSEYEVIKSHTVIGSEILSNISTIETAREVARHHHERYDGNGYPDKIKGDGIPYEARIVCIADAYDAMNSRRIYRNNLTKEKIRQELVEGRGKQFDPEYLDVFLELFDADKLVINEEVIGDHRISESGLILKKVMETMSQQSAEVERDSLTGLMLRKEGEQCIIEAMQQGKGYLAFIDIDNLKKINDTVGHIAGDAAIKAVGDILSIDSENTIACRIGGDEFLYYMKNFTLEMTENRIKSIIDSFEQVKSQNISITQASVSAGICATDVTDIFEEVRTKADKALYYVKQNGKADYFVHRDSDDMENAVVKNVDITKLLSGLEKSGGYEGALDMDYRGFAKIFEYMKNIEDRYEYESKMALITLDPASDKTVDLEEIEQAMNCMEKAIQSTIRNVDVYTRYSSVQYLVIIFEVQDEKNAKNVINRVFQNFYKLYDKNNIKLSYDIASMEKSDK